MKMCNKSLGWIDLVLGLVLLPSGAFAEGAKVRLFILSGQSNMVGLDPNVSFTPALKKAFPNDDVIVLKQAQSGQPIRRWYKAWKAPAGTTLPTKANQLTLGGLYDNLIAPVKKAMEGKKVDTIVFVWMQGERDAKEGLSAVYADSLRGLIKQLRDDLKRPDMGFVIGRLSDCLNGEKHWDAVRAIQEKVATEDSLGAWVDTDDLNGPQNALHYTKSGYQELGRRFAAKSIELQSKQAPKR